MKNKKKNCGDGGRKKLNKKQTKQAKNTRKTTQFLQCRKIEIVSNRTEID